MVAAIARPRVFALAAIACVLYAETHQVPGAGNLRAAAIGRESTQVQTALRFLIQRSQSIRNPKIREQTIAALTEPAFCIASRAGLNAKRKASIIQALHQEHLLDLDSDGSGVFPPVLEDGSGCPHLPQPFSAAPGSSFGGHHSYPGGLAIHEYFNSVAAENLASAYRQVYRLRADDIDSDLITAPPLWHDWAKAIVFQWNEDGTEFEEISFGGNGKTDNYGAAGDSRTGAHHILGIAETMKRGFPPELVIAQACAHSAPTLGNEYKVVNWLRAAAVLAQVDPVTHGYLHRDSSGRLRLPGVVRVEYIVHNLSDADYSFSIPAMTSSESLLAELAPRFGFDSQKRAIYNTRFRNVVLSNLSADRLFILYSNGGINAVANEIEDMRGKLK